MGFPVAIIGGGIDVGMVAEFDALSSFISSLFIFGVLLNPFTSKNTRSLNKISQENMNLFTASINE